ADVVVDSLGLMHEHDQAAAFAERAAALAPGGVLLMFFHSLASIVDEAQWSALRHDHHAYYSLTALAGILERSGLAAVDAYPSPLYGLSVLLVIHRAEDVAADRRPGPGYAGLRAAEERLTDPAHLRERLQGSVQRSVDVLRGHLEAARAAGRSLYGYPAGSRAVALITLAGIGPDLLAGIGDASPAKHGRATPGTRIPILTPEELVAAEPHEVLVLLPEMLPEVLAAHPELAGRLAAYHPNAERVAMPDTIVTEFARSNELQDKLHALVPGGAHTYARGADQYPARRAPVLVRGEGALAWDADNNCFVEYGIGLRAVTLGHAHPHVDQAVRRVLADGINFSRPTRLEAEVAELFLDGIPGAEMVKFAKNGSDVTTAAVKIARAHTGRDMVALCDQSFFSVDDWWIAHTEMDRGIPDGVRQLGVKFPFNNLPALERVFAEHGDRLAAVVLQPAAATEEPAPGYLEAVRALCDRHGTVLVFDEIITGYRWHRGGVQTLSGVRPDLACWAKGIGNGYPISALTGRAELLDLGGLRTDEARAFTVSTTYGPESVGLTALRAVTEVYATEDPMVRMRRAGEMLARGINEAVADAGLERAIGVTGHPNCLIFWTNNPITEDSSQPLRTVLMGELIACGVLGQSLVTCAAHDDEPLVRHTIDAFHRSLPVYRRAVEEGAETVLSGAPPVAPALRRLAFPRRI
ncbi:MAG: glutamate-1-semialdehyde 2,1-aminomutase, partial [Propionibacteriaceae bacterium]|nr:glutamate-1-semialdehyde 2,1-aminomutase [Propionibacteriaceae bacterium]